MNFKYSKNYFKKKKHALLFRTKQPLERNLMGKVLVFSATKEKKIIETQTKTKTMRKKSEKEKEFV